MDISLRFFPNLSQSNSCLNFIYLFNKVFFSSHHVSLFSLIRRIEARCVCNDAFQSEKWKCLNISRYEINYAFDGMNDKMNSRAIRQTLHAEIFLDEFKLIKRENLQSKGAVICERTRARAKERER